jgi:16S rRNA (uracil1498-N3)-methyltransferase
MRRFHIDPANISNNRAVLDGDDARHLQQVLRIKTGETILLFDGIGTIYTAEVDTISKSTVETIILESQKEANHPPYLHLAQCVLKKKKMELIVQKSTELGIDSFFPIISQNCSLTYQPSTQKSRWQKIACESCKQCGRSFVPHIQDSVDISAFLTKLPQYDTKILLWENESNNRLKPFDSGNPPHTVLLLIGPEGGFTRDEVSMALSAGFAPATLGDLTLRAETAAIAALAITQYLLNVHLPGAKAK